MCGTYDASLLNEFFASRMANQGRGLMCGGWKKSGAHTMEWMNKTQEFIDRAFFGPPDEDVKCPCSRCRNTLREDKRTLTLHLCKFGFMLGYEVWTHHGETVHQRTTSVAEEEDDRSGQDRMDEMLDVIWPELETHHKDPSTPEVQKFFNMLRALEESLYEHMIVSALAFVTHLTSIKSKFAFSNKCYKELLSLFSDVLPSNHKMPKDMYQSKNCYLLLVWSTRRLIRAKIIACFSTKSTRMRQND
jgi:hypothetical protein